MTSYLAIITSALVAVSGTVVAVSFDLLPERVDLVGFVLQGAGLGALVATALAVVRNAKKSERAGSRSATPTERPARSASSCSWR